MAPKATDGVSADAANFQFIFAVLKHNKSKLKPAWDDVAKDSGISYGRNANTKFKDLIKKHGYKVEAGNIVLIDKPAAVARLKKPAQTNRTKPKAPAGNKKGRSEAQDDENDVLDGGEDMEEGDTGEEQEDGERVAEDLK